ncbi:FAD dependent oxidoreductase [Streptomyces albus]|uniref:FAD dependent oxidoreductase n=1 Tax=Streptomyces albus (strain ATCC 21838 / DSM 41398 / FERM P-419 / JCM 4703 / NBRC 107858) TaxID=1081613 RepID=A0A0B5EMU7_STRA4|nr:FAD dependent oxidoreductase [Streptomyces albus]AOU78133.1 FAD dependent oxidoreductase [Streptomyces albus]
MRTETVDVVIVGARCAGTAAAVPLARAGHRVVVLDKARFPSDTMSTHVLVPNGVQELAFMGALVGILALGPSRSRYLTLQDGDVELRERFRRFNGIDYAICVPRDQQDAVLVDAARAAGAEVREQTKVEQVIWQDDRAVGVRCRDRDGEYELRAALVVGADGRRSRIAAEVGAWTPYRASRNGRGFVFRYLDDPLGSDAPDALQIFRAEGDQVLVLPSCPAGRTLVVNMTDAEVVPEYRRDVEGQWIRMLDRNPALKERIGGATEVGALRSTTDLAAYYRRSSGPGWALAGDAGHFKDPVTGNGMRDALKFGRLLGEAAAAHLHDPLELDAALLAWEAARDADTLSTYHWGNRETRPAPTSPLVREVLRTFVGDDSPQLSDTFNRARPVESVISPARLTRGLVRALRAPGADRKAIWRELRTELPMEIGIRRHRLVDGFRSRRPVTTERAGWTLGDPVRPRPASSPTGSVEAPEAQPGSSGPQPVS